MKSAVVFQQQMGLQKLAEVVPPLKVYELFGYSFDCYSTAIANCFQAPIERYSSRWSTDVR